MIWGWYVKYSSKRQRWWSEWWLRGVWVAHRRRVIMGLLELKCVWLLRNERLLRALPQRAALQTPASSISHWGTSEDREQRCIHRSAPDMPYAQVLMHSFAPWCFAHIINPKSSNKSFCRNIQFDGIYCILVYMETNIVEHKTSHKCHFF